VAVDGAQSYASWADQLISVERCAQLLPNFCSYLLKDPLMAGIGLTLAAPRVDLLAEPRLAVQPGPGHSRGLGEPSEGDRFTAPRQALQGGRGAAQGSLVPGPCRFAETIKRLGLRPRRTRAHHHPHPD
jgi:hypothetical protein